MRIFRTTEGTKYQCSQYWPDSIGDIISYGDEKQFVVTLVVEEENESFVERNLNIEHRV